MASCQVGCYSIKEGRGNGGNRTLSMQSFPLIIHHRSNQLDCLKSKLSAVALIYGYHFPSLPSRVKLGSVHPFVVFTIEALNVFR